jgi:flagellar motor component MotA
MVDEVRVLARRDLEGVEQRVRAEIAGLASEPRSETRDQTWRLMGTVLVAMGLVAAVGLVAAILRVGRSGHADLRG